MTDYNDPVGKVFKCFNHYYTKYIIEVLKTYFQDQYLEKIKEFTKDKPIKDEFETPIICTLLIGHWSIFSVHNTRFQNFQKSLIHEVRHFRNMWAHQNVFTAEDAYRCVDSCFRLLKTIECTTGEEYTFKIKAWLLGEASRTAKLEYQDKKKQDTMELIEID